MDSFISTLIGIVVGGAITWFVSWLYYHKAGEDLAREAEKLRESGERLRQGIRVLARALEEGGIAEVTWGPDRDPIGLVYRLSVGNALRATATMKADLDVKKASPDTPTGADES